MCANSPHYTRSIMVKAARRTNTVRIATIKKNEPGKSVDINQSGKTQVVEISKKMGPPLVTIVTPVYNQGDSIGETIRSVLNQTYRDVEYIIVDDGSTDETAAAVKKFGKRVDYYYQKNKGQAAALNAGWRRGKGALLGYLSADDLLAADAVTRMVKFITTHKVEIAYCDYDLIDGESNLIREVSCEEFERRRLTVDLHCAPGPGAFFTREVFQKLGGWNEVLCQVPDYEFWLRASETFTFKRKAESLAKFRVHKASSSFRPISEARSREIVQVVDAYWNGHNGKDACRARAMARVIEAKHHFNARRYANGIHASTHAAVMCPGLVITASFWRVLLSGAFRRIAFSLRPYLVQKRTS